MRIAHFVQRYPPALGGSEAYFARLSRYLHDCGHHVTVFTTNALALEAFWSTRGRCLRAGMTWEDGIAVHRYRLWRCPEQRRMLKVLSLVPVPPWQCLTLSCNPIAWRMWWDAGHAQESFDLVHATAFPYGWILACALRLARRLRVPFLVTPFLHLGDPLDPGDRTRGAYLSAALLSVLHAADGIFVQTTVERDALLERGFAAEKLILQGMGVDLAGCTGGDRKQTRAAWCIGPDEVVVGHLANNSREKGSVDLLRAAEQAWRHGSRFRLILAGPEMPNFRTFWNSYGPRAQVMRLGVLQEIQKRDFFASIDVFAMPSRSDSFGLVFLEAWANGVPNLAYRAGGVQGVIRDGEDGLLARCGSLRELTDGLIRLTADPDLRYHLGQTGRARLTHEFRWEDKLAQVQTVYHKLTERRNGEAGIKQQDF